MIIEKPFGRDLESARALNAELKHVLTSSRSIASIITSGKETVQNILVFRFANGIFEPIWNRRYIDHVQITVGGDESASSSAAATTTQPGALRDMVQNHLFQLISLIAMEPPISFEPTPCATRRSRCCARSSRSAPRTCCRRTVRGQYGAGEHGETSRARLPQRGQASPRDSNTETFVALKLFIDNWRWAGVPFYLRTGKRLPQARHRDRDPVPARAARAVPRHAGRARCTPNLLVIRIQPDEGISLRFGAKVPGPVMRLGTVNMDFNYTDYFGARPDRLRAPAARLHDRRRDAVPARRHGRDWLEVITPILDVWKALPPRTSPTMRPAPGDRKKPTTCWRAILGTGARSSDQPRDLCLSRSTAAGARGLRATLWFAARGLALACQSGLAASPRVILISLDGAKPDLIDSYLGNGTLDPKTGLGLLKAKGISATQNITATPSLTAVSHIAIATGSTAAKNNIPANTYHAVAQPIGNTTSGFSGPIGGYQISPLGPSPAPTAQPMWVALRAAGKKVVTATWPGGDGLNVTLFGTTGTPTVQSAAPTRTVDYTVPFGAFGGIGAQGFKKTTADFSDDVGGTITAALLAAGRVSYSPVKVTGVLESVTCGDTTSNCILGHRRPLPVPYCSPSRPRRSTAATTESSTTTRWCSSTPAPNADPAGPLRAAIDRPRLCKVGGPSAKFFFEGSGLKIGTAFFVSTLAPDLSLVRFARYSSNFIPRNAPSSPTSTTSTATSASGPRRPISVSPSASARASMRDLSRDRTGGDYEDQVRTFVAYQTSVALRALKQNQDADLVMIYIEQPDGSGHQFTLTDPRQPTDFLDNRTVGPRRSFRRGRAETSAGHGLQWRP